MKDAAKMYDTYVSLGNNCETAFQIRRVLGRDSSSFFSWNVTRFGALISLLNADFAGILQLENLRNEPDKGLIHDASHNFLFHSDFKTKNIAAEDNFAARFADMSEKTQYLVGKFKTEAATGQRTVYFYKTEEHENARRDARAVRDLLAQRHGAHDFALVIAQHETAREAAWNDSKIFNRYLKRTAPWDDAPDGHVMSWDKIFEEFPHKDGLRLAF